MLVWGIILFGLGVLAVLDSQFNYGYVFRSANSILFMLVSLGVLVRTRMLTKKKSKERLLESMQNLETQVEVLASASKLPEKQNKEQDTTVSQRR